MSTSEAQVIARALYDSLLGKALETLRGAAASGTTTDALGSFAQTLPQGEVRNLLGALAADGRAGQLAAVADAFQGMTQRGSATLSAEVISAETLSAEQQQRIADDLHAKYGQLDLSFSIDATLIGGLIIRVGDQVLDNSLRARLSAVQRNMLAS